MATCTDTLARASEARSKQGTHELEISFGGELDLHKHFQSCTKNPGHLNFIPIDSLRMRHLPEVLRTKDTFDWIKYISKRTVKLSVRYVSSHRQPPLPLSDCAGQDILTVGSGFMSDICLVEGKHEMPCPFDNCPEQPGQHQVYGYIIITTAAHVVFDDDEAKNTTVEFFYDNPNDRNNVRTARGVKVGTVSVDGDFCELLCVTHDRQLFDSIEENMHFKEVVNVVIEDENYYELQCVTHDKQLFDFLVKEDENVPLVRDEVFRGYIRTPLFYIECRKKDDIACPLEECQYLSESHNVYGYIFITIKTNVMFDYQKVKSATIKIFYKEKEDTGNILTARAEVVNVVIEDENYYELQCVTHDKQLFDFLTHGNYKQSVRCYRDEEIVKCDLFQRFPCMNHVNFTDRNMTYHGQELFVDITRDNVSDCAELLVSLLISFFDKIVNNIHTTYSNKNLLFVEKKINVINDKIELNTSLVRRQDLSFYISNSVKHQDLVLQLKNLLMEVPINVDRLNTFLINNKDKETRKRINVRQIDENMLRLHYRQFGNFDNVLDEYLQILNIGNVLDEYLQILNIDNVLDEYFQRLNIDNVLDENLQILNIDNALDENFQRLNIDNVLDENLQILNIDNVLDENFQRLNIDDVLDENLQILNIDDRDNEHGTSHDKLVVHISHPHGQSKQISFGTQTDCFTGDGHYMPLYTATTCPGCSGGPVWMMPATNQIDEIYGVPHGGCHDNRLNHGCSWTLYPQGN